MPMFRSFFLFCFSVFLLFPTTSDALEMKRGTPRVTVELATNFDKVNPHQNLEVLLKFTMHHGWHIFSQDTGDIGLPTVVNWQLPFSYKLKSHQWSLDEEFVTEGIVQRGYGKNAYYKAVIEPSEDVFNKAVLVADVEWLACREECIPEKATFFIKFPVTQQDLRPSTRWERLMQKAQHAFTPNAQLYDINFFVVLLLAFGGGIVLNFMPCIFPILALKVIALVKSRENKITGKIEAMLYSLGVLFSFLIVATILLLLRLGGEEIGWGFQLQSPIFVGIMAIIFFVIFLMLFDLISIPNPWLDRLGKISLKKQLYNSFITGFFAVLIASPCTAPFMGIAVAYALSAPIYVYYPVFAVLAIGYALPFALAGFFPQAINRVLPKPGKWMDTLKKIFSIPVLLTCFWLLWVLANQLLETRGKNGDELQWRPYNSLEVAEAVREKKPVFIDFTAKWCITCLVNKKIALQSDEFVNLVKQRNILLYQADWTNKDDTITSALEEYGRNSIPLYVYYNGKSEKYVILPQLLTSRVLRNFLK